MSKFDGDHLFTVLSTKCPHCHEVKDFAVGEEAAYLLDFFGLKFGKDAVRLLYCRGCRYKEYLEDEFFGEWKEFGEKYKEFKEGELEEEEFKAYLKGVEIPELKELLVASAMWHCACGEENPPNFSECWKCGAAATVEPVEVTSKAIDLADRHPWER